VNARRLSNTICKGLIREMLGLMQIQAVARVSCLR
jgi:hypothetical protein